MPTRHESSAGYRYGYNGKENDNTIKGTGNSVDFGARMYDSRLGRWFAVDPLTKSFPSQSPYNFVYNDVIRKTDIGGLYGSDGHFWTVYALGLSMGLSKTDALELAKASEYYDNIVHGTALRDITFETNDGGNVFGFSVPTWSDPDFQSLYHGLGGGASIDVKQRAIEGIEGGNLYDLHLFGDAFAHARKSTNYEVMYGECHGCFTTEHADELLGEGFYADDIDKHQKQYLKYVKGLACIIDKILYENTNNYNEELFIEISKLDKNTRINVLKGYIASKTGERIVFEYDEKLKNSFNELGIKYTIKEKRGTRYDTIDREIIISNFPKK
jgi:RHS repeat-associated protein